MILGITGGIASGKSAVAKIFAELGAPVVSADDLARAAVAPGQSALEKLRSRFGDRVTTASGDLDRAALAAIVFDDSAARAQLNAIVHPAIAALAEEALARLTAEGHPLIIYEAPLLFEAGAEKRVDAVLVVKIDARLQQQRLRARDHLDTRSAKVRIAAQLPQEEKLARADYVIDNSGSLAETRRQVEDLYARLCR